MVEDLTVEPNDIGKLIGFIGQGMAFSGGDSKARDLVNEFQTVFAFGLLMAKRQPELADACFHYWSSASKVDSDNLLDQLLKSYKEYASNLKTDV